jgi:hypothetical protein
MLIEARRVCRSWLVDVRLGCRGPDRIDHLTQPHTPGQAFGCIVLSLEGDGVVVSHSVRHRDTAGDAVGEFVAVFRPPVLRRAVAARRISVDAPRLFGRQSRPPRPMLADFSGGAV